MHHRIQRLALLALCALLATATTGCENTTGPDGSAGRVALSLAVPSTGTTARTAGVRSYALDDTAGNSLVIDRVALVLAEIELEADGYECPSDPDSLDDDDGCEEIERGPILVDFEPFAGMVEQDIALTDIPAGFEGVIFDELEFEIEVPDDDEGEDPALFLGEGVSVLVEGSYNGSDFVYRSDLEAEQELEGLALELPLVGGQLNVTLLVDLQRWFRDGQDRLVDPATANVGGLNEELVEENIVNSFDAFEDDDEDGEPDDDDGDDD